MTEPPATTRPVGESPRKPLWRASYDLVEKHTRAPLTDAVHSDLFADVLAIRARAKRLRYRVLERATRRVLHAANLPAATDIRRLQEQMAALQRQVSRLAPPVKASPPPEPPAGGSR